MHEALGITDLQSRHPPVLHVRLISISHVDAAPTADNPFIAVIEDFEAMQVV